jgi:hypothetical protein
MPLSTFDALPDEARLWLLAFEHPTEPAILAQGMDVLLEHWHHKGVHYQAAWTLLENRILAVAEPTLAAQPSGCAIDGMLRGVKQLVTKLGLGLEDPQSVIVRQAGTIQAIPRTELAARLSEGSLDDATPVLDLALLTLGDLRQGRLERPLATTWIRRKYRDQVATISGT